MKTKELKKTEKIEYRTWDEVKAEIYANKNDLDAYIKYSIKEYQKSGTEDALIRALGLAIKIKGYSKVAKKQD